MGNSHLVVVGQGGGLSFKWIENIYSMEDISVPYGTYFEESSIQLGGVNSDGDPAAKMYVSRFADGTLERIGLDLMKSDVEYMLMHSESISFYNDTDKTDGFGNQAR